MSYIEHKAAAPSTVRVQIITVSDTRTLETDKSGMLISEMLGKNNHKVIERVVIKDDQETIKNTVKNGVDNKEIDAILLNGGTGISKRDVTYEVIESMLEKELTGFGELFRMLSFTEDIGSPAMLSRAIGGVLEDTAIFALPGSSGAVKLGMSRLILPELPHVVREINK
ncbi:MogA/MoaB family molybdenum cofactor biosynthesis protein [Guptibacillus algicola]|uniref:MogA/MoaB family molybdenum cofactor biosynthesis protein n=1 Tax=Guptibacillus algicola TaxID=225844 RepID=UPI001CD5FAF5|nr:MogA/MoaB family molybdenum cofactor biosynthesis protein [Alkalihalobacillus algicola]MCA0986355.1 MogA/MoaB family molybdenum cofactor biosynthesis protein [Alkalihalobacillus algicola]